MACAFSSSSLTGTSRARAAAVLHDRASGTGRRELHHPPPQYQLLQQQQAAAAAAAASSANLGPLSKSPPPFPHFNLFFSSRVDSGQLHIKAQTPSSKTTALTNSTTGLPARYNFSYRAFFELATTMLCPFGRPAPLPEPATRRRSSAPVTFAGMGGGGGRVRERGIRGRRSTTTFVQPRES